MAAQFNVNFVDADDRRTSATLAIDNGFIKVPVVGTGFMMIRRHVFEVMKSKLPDAGYINDIAGYQNQYTEDNFYTFFDTMLHPKSRRYLSEDYAFCYKWVTLCGGEIYLNVEHQLTHFGNYAFAGSFLTAGASGAL